MNFYYSLIFNSKFYKDIISILNFYYARFGIALAALGMLSTLAVCLAIDGYGPVSDNAGGIVEMCEMGENIR